MECHACGRHVDAADRFCNGCGTAVDAAATSSPKAPEDVTPGSDHDGSSPSGTHSSAGELTDSAGDPNVDATEAGSRHTDADTGTDTAATADSSGADADAAAAGEQPAADRSVATADPSETPDSAPARTASTGADRPGHADLASSSPRAQVHDEPTPSPGGPATVSGEGGEPTGERTQLIAVADDEEWQEPAWAATGSLDAQNPATGDLPATEPITEVWARTPAADTPPPTPYDFVEREPVAITGQIPQQPVMTEQMTVMPIEPVAEPRHGFRFGVVMLLALAIGVISLGAMFADIIAISSDVRLVVGAEAPATFRTGTWTADDLADNLPVAGLVIAVLVVAGGVASAYGWRWGSGLAGGAGLAMAGVAALTIGLAQFPIDVARQFARIPSDDPFVLTITRDLGYWLLVVGGALGVVLFFSSINDARGDGRPGLNPWIAALGALSVVVAASGPLINENQAVFSDNWYLVDAPGEPTAILLVGRLVQLGLLVLGGVVGFLSVGRWGLGMVAGAALPSAWLMLSVLFELTDRPVGPGFRNPGAIDMHVHGVTIIGICAIVAMLVLAMVGAYDQSSRNPRPLR